MRRLFIFLGVTLFQSLSAQHNGTENPHSDPHHYSHSQSSFTVKDLSPLHLLRWQLVAGLGMTRYFGEVTSRYLKSDNNMLRNSRIGGQIALGVSYRITEKFSARFEVSRYSIGAKESNVLRDYYHRTNNYEFKATNWDFNLMGQFNFKRLTLKPKDKPNVEIVPYCILGIGLTTNNPKGKLNSDWVPLNETSNERIYDRPVVIIPAGFGAVYRLSNSFDIGLEASTRFCLKGSIDGTYGNGFNGSGLNQEQLNYFSQYYNNADERQHMLRDNRNLGDIYTLLQIKLFYTYIAPKYGSLYMLKNINYQSQ